MLGKEEAAAVAPHEKDFLHECLRVKREREGLPTLPHSGYSSPVNGAGTWGLSSRTSTSENTPGRSWFGPVTRIVRTGRNSLDKCGEGMRNGEWEVSDLMADISDLTHRAKKTDRRLSKLEQNALSHAKVASEFQRVWTGITSLADRTMQEIQKVQAMQAQVEGHQRRGSEGRNVAELSSGELSPFSTTSESSERPAAGCSLSSIKDANIETDQKKMHGEDMKKSPSQLQKGLPDIDAIIEHRLNLYELAHEERDKRMNSILLNEVSTLENRFKEFEGAAEEEARRLERVECELHQQLLSSKQNIERLETQIDALLIFKENLGMELNILKGGLQDYFNHKDHVQRCNTDLELDVCNTKRNLEDKIERLTVMIADMHNRETAMSKERKQAETLEDVHQILRTLGTAVKALQRHVAKNNSEMHSVRETFQNIRLNLRQHEGAVNGYLESWSVESSGMTQQILSLWKIVRAQAHTQAQEHLSTDSLSLSERGLVAATTGEHDRDSPRGGESSTRESEKQSDTSVVDAESSCNLHRKGSNSTQWPHPPPLQPPTHPRPPPHRPHP